MKRLVLKKIFGIMAILIISSLASAQIDKHTTVIWLFDEMSGKTVKDQSGNGNDLTIMSGKLGEGKFDNALHLNGTSDSAQIDTQVINGVEGTIELWVRVDNPAKNDQHFIYTSEGGGDGWGGEAEFHLGYRNSLNFCCDNGARIWDMFSGIIPQKGRWYHLAGVWKDKEIAQLYVDGKVAVETKPAEPITFAKWKAFVYLGKPAANTRFLEGALDEIRISSVVRSAKEIQKSMKGLKLKSVKEASLLAIIWANLKSGD
jgi:hypothetical protein